MGDYGLNKQMWSKIPHVTVVYCLFWQLFSDRKPMYCKISHLITACKYSETCTRYRTLKYRMNLNEGRHRDEISLSIVDVI